MRQENILISCTATNLVNINGQLSDLVYKILAISSEENWKIVKKHVAKQE